MLNAIRTAAANWLGRLVLVVVMGLLIVSFAIWGIGDIFRGNISRNVATVGDAVISADAYRAAFNEELRRIQQRVRRPVTTEDARAFGLDRQVLNRMIDESAMNQAASKLGLAIDQAAIVKAVTEADVFRRNGQFDRGAFSEILQQNGLSEPQFFRQQGELMLRQQLANGLVGGFAWPETFGKALHQYENEARDLEVIAIPAEKAGEIEAPDDQTLRSFHAERKGEFRTVETRKATILATSPTQFAGDVVLSEADLKAYYDRVVAAGRFGTPEKRKVDRVLFDTEADAKAAAERLAGGLSWEALLTERKLSAADVDLGLKTRSQIADKALGDAIFALAPNAISAPVKDVFGYVLLRLVAVEPAKVTPFSEVRAQIEGEARLDAISRNPAVRAKLEGVYRQVEDQRIAGKSLAEAAKVAGLVPVVIESLDKQGQDGAGKPLSIAGGMETVNAIFASDIGLDNEPIQQKDGGYVWLEVNGIEPAREKTFDEVKDDVRTRYVADQRSKTLGELATKLVADIAGGKSMQAVAAELGVPVQTFSAIKRNSREPVLGQNGVTRAFAGTLGTAVSALAPDGVGRLLIRPVSASLLPFDAASAEAGGWPRQIGQAMAEDLIAQYVAALRKGQGASVNQAILNQALGQTN